MEPARNYERPQSPSFAGLCFLCRSPNHRRMNCPVYNNKRVGKRCHTCLGLHFGICKTHKDDILPGQSTSYEATPQQRSNPQPCEQYSGENAAVGSNMCVKDQIASFLPSDLKKEFDLYYSPEEADEIFKEFL